MPFCTTDPQVRNDWLTVGAATQLRGASEAAPWCTRLLGAQLRLWRTPDGDLQCRCDAGQAWPVQQHCDYLWVCTGTPPAAARFTLPEFNEPGRRIVDCGGIGVATSAPRVVENFLDMAHFPYIHTGTLGQVPHCSVAPYDVAIDPSTQEIHATNCRFYQPQASASAAGGIEAQYRYRVMQPFSAALYKSSPNHPGAQDVIGLFVQPVDEEHSIAHCLLVYFEDQLCDAELIAFQHMIFGQDKPILESHRPKRLPLGGPLETHMRCDLSATTYRRWLRGRGLRFGIHADPDSGSDSP